MLRPLLLALCLAFAACGTEPTPSPLDAPASDVAPETGSDAAAEAGPDVELDAPADQLVEVGPDAAPDLVTEVGVDATEEAPPDAPAEVGVDAAPEAGPDAALDAAPLCTSGTTRCPPGPEGIALDYCVAGMWVPSECPAIGLAGVTGVCSAGQCYSCRRVDGGVGCASEPLCEADVDCYRIGQGRCVGGRCAARGALRCSGDMDCAVWSTPSTREVCRENRTLGGAPVMTCGSTVQRCAHDAMCPATHRCDVSSGFCLAR